MGNLPRARLNITRPFRHSVVDYAGLISIKISSLRSAVVSKGYICLFVCMVTKAIHLEAVSNLTTSAFLAAFKRFVSRRGQYSSSFEALTPAHFLVGEPTTCLQDECLLDTKPDLLSRWKTVEKLKQHFSKRWRNEYLNRLQARPKWLKSENEPEIGDLVLVVDDPCGQGQWLLGRVENVRPGPDGLIRVVSVILKNKTIQRPMSKICLLPEKTNI
ncbi:uncharacterized protein LOC142224966 [Haematobia irritans]|uniref:uncharacterized protein LOC142224966 n=1 Tax=Haematobia irritans TaxID=7368 RepID=UPI003F4F9E4B